MFIGKNHTAPDTATEESLGVIRLASLAEAKGGVKVSACVAPDVFFEALRARLEHSIVSVNDGSRLDKSSVYIAENPYGSEIACHRLELFDGKRWFVPNDFMRVGASLTGCSCRYSGASFVIRTGEILSGDPATTGSGGLMTMWAEQCRIHVWKIV